MKRAAPWEQSHAISSDDSSSSDSEDDAKRKKDGKFKPPTSSKGAVVEGALIRRAEMYQEYMKHIPVPAHRGSVVPFTSWLGLARSVKQLYGQPLHYLTNILLKQWDQQRIGSDDERRPLDAVIHPVKAEALIWVTEEVHRLTASIGMPRKKKPGGVDFDALSRHGYRGGPSVLKVPPPKIEPDWSWSTGKERDAKNDPVEESDEERDAVIEGLQGNIPPRSKIEKDENLSFSQKEKRKRDLGQASRGKNYVEEEKRLLRESGVYSGFDS